MMKKTLVALAAVAATASFAQSSVTINGAISTALSNESLKIGATTNTSTGFFNNPTGTSSVIFSGVEDLGGGMKGLFLYEIDPNANLANTAALSGEVFVGLSGGWGSLKLGSPNQPSLGVQAGRNPFGTKIGGGFSSMLSGIAPTAAAANALVTNATSPVQGALKVRMNSSLRYDSPNFGGFTAAIGFAPEVPAQTGTSTVASTGGGTQTDIALGYANGPLALGVSFFSQNQLAVGSAVVPAGSAGSRQTNLFGQYAFGAVRVFFGAHNGDSITAGGVSTNDTGNNIGLRYDFANMTVMGNFAVRRNAAANTDQRVWGLGFDYNLSKRTAAVIRASEQTNDSGAAATAGSNRVMMAGLIHKF